MERSSARAVLHAWIDDELHQYADQKWEIALERKKQDEALQVEGVGPGTFWRDFIDQYLHRAQLLGLDTPGGQQALLKAVVTAFECGVSLICTRDSIPAPGRPSGDVQ